MAENTVQYPVELVRSQLVFISDFYEIKDFAYNSKHYGPAREGFNDCFCIVFVRKGQFLAELSTDTYDSHTGHILVEKANNTYKLRPATGECTILNFSDAFYEQLLDEYNLKNAFFFANPDLLSLLLTATPGMDYLHHQIMSGLHQRSQLETDQLVLELVQCIVEHILDRPLISDVSTALRRNHLATIENAKAYMQANFQEDVSLLSLSTHCAVSLFHFCRIFKQFTTYSPHQYVVMMRLAHAERLLRSTLLPIADVCFSSGFNSLEHFATAFRQKHGQPPTQYRNQTA